MTVVLLSEALSYPSIPLCLNTVSHKGIEGQPKISSTLTGLNELFHQGLSVIHYPDGINSIR
jgi:hypothetical protein